MFPRSTIQFLFLLFVSASLLCCKDKEVEPLNLILNGDLESGAAEPTFWWNDRGQGEHDFQWSKAESLSGERSIKISADVADDQNFAYWFHYLTENLPFERTITLKVNIKAELVGTGVSIAIRADGDNANSAGALQFETTGGGSPITGSFDWKEFSITLENLDPQTKTIYVFLIYLEDTTGEVYFDDISLTY